MFVVPCPNTRPKMNCIALKHTKFFFYYWTPLNVLLPHVIPSTQFKFFKAVKVRNAQVKILFLISVKDLVLDRYIICAINMFYFSQTVVD